MDRISGLPYNSFSGEFVELLLEQTFGKQAMYTPDQMAYILDFLYPLNYTLNHHRLNGGKLTTRVPRNKLNFHSAEYRMYQEQILQDMHPNIVIIKSRQLGLTEVAVAKTLHWIDVFASQKANAGYFFPTYKQLNAFIKTRFNTVLEDEYLKSIVDPNMNNQDVKKIRDSFIHFRTSSKPGAAEGIDLSFAAVDEYDRVGDQAIQSITNSLKGNQLQYMLRFSTPSAPGIGVDRLYDTSDQWYWEYKCAHCGREQDIKYKDYVPGTAGDDNGNVQLVNHDGINLAAKSVAEGTYRYVCRYCGEPLDRVGGKWACRYPERTTNNSGIRGYYISQTNAVWISASQLKESELNSSSKQEFFNYDLGLPFLDRKVSVIPEDIYDHATRIDPAKSREDYSLITVGIDWGVQHSVVVEGMRENGHIEVINNFQVSGIGVTDANSSGSDMQKIVAMLTPYSPDLIIADTGDAGDKIRKLMTMMGANKVYGCTNNSSPTTGLATSSGSIKPVWNPNTNIVKVDKLLENKRHIALIKEGGIGFYKKQTPELKRLAKHWGNVIIKTIESNSGVQREVVTRRSSDNEGGDHYAQSEILANLGMDYLREKGSESEFGYDFLSINSDEPTDINKQFNDDLFN